MEKLRLKLWLIVVLWLLLFQGISSKAEPIGTGFTYQGQLTDADVPANGLYDFEFKLFDAPADGNQVGPTLSFFDVFVDDGYFMSELEFPNDDPLRFWGSGEARWLEIAVRPALPIAENYPLGEPGLSMDTPGYTILSPRQKITPTPYALHALTSSTGPGPGPLLVGGSGTDKYIPRWLTTTDLGDSIIYQTDPGNVGIGTTSPDRKLHVVSAEDGQIKVKGTDPTGFGGLVLYNNRDRAGFIGVGGEYNPNADIQNSLFLSSPGDFDIVFQHAGSTKAIIKPDGKVGIGTTAPGARLEVAGRVKITGGSPGDGKVLTSDASGLASWQPAGGLTAGTNGQTLRHDGTNWVANSVLYNNGMRIGIGTNSPKEKVDVSRGNIILSEPGGTMRYIMLQRNGRDIGSLSTANARISIGAKSGYDAMIGNSSGDGIIVKNSSGNVGIGTTTPTEKLDVNGTARFRQIGVGTGATLAVDSNGKLLKAGISSRRYKTNIRDLESDHNRILELRPVRFQWKTTGQDEIGLIAEEVDAVAKDLVIYDQEGKPDAVKYDRVGLYLLKVVKDLKSENESLKQRLDTLEKTIENIEQHDSSVVKEVLQ